MIMIANLATISETTIVRLGARGMMTDPTETPAIRLDISPRGLVTCLPAEIMRTVVTIADNRTGVQLTPIVVAPKTAGMTVVDLLIVVPRNAAARRIGHLNV